MVNKAQSQSACRKIHGSHFYLAACLALLFLWQGNALAHAPQENYIWINVEEDHIDGRFEVNVNDVRDKLGINVDSPGASRIDGVRTAQGYVQSYFLDHFSIADSKGQLELEFLPVSVFEDNPDFLQFPFKTARLPEDNKLVIRNTVFLTQDMMTSDRLHRSLIVVEYNRSAEQSFGPENVALVFSPEIQEHELDLSNPPAVLQWKEFLWQGILHIAIGLDHVIFIILLLLTTVLRPFQGSWEPQPGFKSAFWKTLKIVTLFTIAHSITLSLAALELVALNTALVETIIALSIVALAINNMYPKYGAHTGILIFTFGLFHGLGFASVMGNMQFRTVLIERILVMFNLGVEIGQLTIVLLLFPLFFLIRKSARYLPWIVNPISGAAALVATFWALQRSGALS